MRGSAEFWDKLADKYSKKPVKDIENYNKTLDCTRKHLSASDEVLEVEKIRRAGRRLSRPPPSTARPPLRVADRRVVEPHATGLRLDIQSPVDQRGGAYQIGDV